LLSFRRAGRPALPCLRAGSPGRLARSSVRMRISSERLRWRRAIWILRCAANARPSPGLCGRRSWHRQRAFNTRRAIKRSVFDVAGLFAEDRAEKLFFRRQLRFAFRRDLQPGCRPLHRGADPDDAGLVQIAQERVGDVRNVAVISRPELGVAGFDFEFFDVDRSVVVFLDQLFADQDGVFRSCYRATA